MRRASAIRKPLRGMRSEMRLRILPDSPGARLFAGQGDFGQRAGGDRFDVDQPQVVEYGLLRHLSQVFRLLLDGAHGTRFSRFLDELVDIEVEYTYKYMEVIGCESVKSGLVTEEFIHIIVTAYFNGMFEVVRHNMDRAAAHRYVKMLNRYHMAGFSTVFDPQS